MPDNESISASPPQPASHAVDNDNTVHLSLPATVDHYDLAALLNPLPAGHQHRVCLDVGRVSRLGTVEFRVLSAFTQSFGARGGFLKLENVSAPLAALVREFGFTDLLPVAAEQTCRGRA